MDLISPFNIFESSEQNRLDFFLWSWVMYFCRKVISVMATRSLVDLFAIFKKCLNSALLPPLPSAMFKQIEAAALRNRSVREKISLLGNFLLIS
jgi:hypothetical protein